MSTDLLIHALDRGMKLHLGCGLTRLDGWVNCDLTKHSEHVDVAFDLLSDWPFEDNTVSAVYCSHTIEHLPSLFPFFQELWRVCMPQASVLLRCPYGGHRSAWGDLTHVRPIYPESFACFQPGYAEAVMNPQHLNWSAFFGIRTVDVRLDVRTLRWFKIPLVRRGALALLPYVPTVCEEIFADLYALKTPLEQARYRSTNVPNAVPLRYIVFRHQWEGRPLPAGVKAELFPIAEGRPLTRAGTQGYPD